jgi:hypothetical protein
MQNWWIPSAVSVAVVVSGYVFWLVGRHILAQIREVARAEAEKLVEDIVADVEEVQKNVSEIEKDVVRMQERRIGDLEVYNVKLGRIDDNAMRHESRCEQRFQDIEGIIGRSRPLKRGQ